MAFNALRPGGTRRGIIIRYGSHPLGIDHAGRKQRRRSDLPKFHLCCVSNPICYQGATPIFVDSEPDTWNMDPILLEQAICDRMKQTGLKPKAILPVHLYGTPARMNEICDIASRYGIPVVEDAAEAMGPFTTDAIAGPSVNMGFSLLTATR